MASERKVGEIKVPSVIYRGGVITRLAQVEGAAEGDAKGARDRYQVAFSSETPVRQWWGEEVLSHDAGDVDLDWLGSGRAPVLVDHRNEIDSRVGVVERAWIGDDRVGRLTFRFLEDDDRAQGLKAQVDAGDAPAISVGYEISRVRLEEEREDGPDLYRVVRWKPLEVSAVSVPADQSVGFGRSAQAGGAQRAVAVEAGATDKQRRDRTLENENETAGATATATGETATGAQRVAPEPGNARNLTAGAVVAATATAGDAVDLDQVRDQELERINGILELGRAHNATAFAEEHVKKRTPLALFKGHMLDHIGRDKHLVKPDTALDLTPREAGTGGFSVLRFYNSIVRNNPDLAPFEHECSAAIAERMGAPGKRGYQVPYEVQRSMQADWPLVLATMQRNGLTLFDAVRQMTSGGAGTGAELVGTDHRSDLFVEALRPQSAIVGFGAEVLQGLQGNIDIPMEAGTATTEWLAEDADNTEANIATGSITLSPKTIASGVRMSRRLLIQSDPSVERMVRNALMQDVPLAIDAAALSGTGAANQPLGIRNQVGVQTVTIADLTNGFPTWSEWVQFETVVAAVEALFEPAMAFITTAEIIGSAKTTAKEAGQAIFNMSDDRQINGYPVRQRQSGGAKSITFGPWRHCRIGSWGVMEIMDDTATAAKSGGLVLRAFHETDVACNHPVAFAIEA